MGSDEWLNLDVKVKWGLLGSRKTQKKSLSETTMGKN